MQIAVNRIATYEFKVTDETGEILDSSEESGPYPYLHGNGHLIPGLESAMEGKSPGETFNVTVPPAQGYGVRDESLVQDIPRDRFAGMEMLYEGMMLEARYKDETRLMTIIRMDDENVTVDGNHPLAGLTLNFDITIIDVREATPEELEQGFAFW
ncbi:MAG: peptidylprolyl isomerase [Dehalococcoidia bacterium]